MKTVLNLGSGNDYKKSTPEEKIINIDIDKKWCTNGVDIVEDMRQMSFKQNSIDKIIAEGCIEHISYRETLPTIIHWYTLLKAEGELIIETPNLERIIRDILKENKYYITHAYETLYGGQRNPTEYHFALHTFNTLRDLLLIAGFGTVIKEKPVNNLESGEDWNVRLKAIKMTDMEFPNKEPPNAIKELRE